MCSHLRAANLAEQRRLTQYRCLLKYANHIALKILKSGHPNQTRGNWKQRGPPSKYWSGRRQTVPGLRASEFARTRTQDPRTRYV